VRYSIRVTEPPETEVLTLDQAKAHLRVDSSDEDDLIGAYLKAAVRHVEDFTSQVLADQEMEIAWCDFPTYPEMIAIPRTPVTEIVSLAYLDSDGVDTPITDFRWSDAAPETVRPAFRAAWPFAYNEPGSVRLRFRAGYGAELVPPPLLQAVRETLEHLYRNRGADASALPETVRSLCMPYRRILI